MQDIQVAADLSDTFGFAQFDPPPASVIAAARAALAERTPGADVAALVFDSVLHDSFMMGISDPDMRVLLFVAPGVALTVCARWVDAGTEITGTYISATDFDVALRLPGTGMVPLDHPVVGGFERLAAPQSTVTFVLRARPPGPPRLVVTDAVVV